MGVTVVRPEEKVQAVGKEPTAATRRLLRLMSTGATDRAIARELGISERTVHRRIARLQTLLGAHSRFQLGVLAANNNWVEREVGGESDR